MHVISQYFSYADYEDYDPHTLRLGSRYSHIQEVQERLNFLRFVLINSAFIVNTQIKDWFVKYSLGDLLATIARYCPPQKTFSMFTCHFAL